MLPWHTKRRRICTIIFLFIGTFSLSSFKSRREKNCIRQEKTKSYSYTYCTLKENAPSRLIYNMYTSQKHKKLPVYILYTARKHSKSAHVQFVYGPKTQKNAHIQFVYEPKKKKALVYNFGKLISFPQPRQEAPRKA